MPDRSGGPSRVILPGLCTAYSVNDITSDQGNLEYEKPALVIVTNVFYPMYGGISTYVQNLEKGFNSKGYEVLLLDFPSHLIKREDAIQNKAIYRLTHEILVSAFIVKALLKIFKLRFHKKKIIVHSQSASFCMTVGVIARLFGAKSIHTFHSPIDKNTIRLRTQLPFLNESVCVSEEQREQYVKVCGIPDNATIIPGGVDCDYFRPPDENERKSASLSMGQRIGLKEGSGKVVTYVGRVVEEKGIEIFLEAAKKVAKVRPDTVFLVVGPLDQTKAQVAYVQGLRKRIDKDLRFYLLGKEDSKGMRILYQASTITVCPSLVEEASSLVVVESMASGVPVISSRIGGLQSRIEDGASGYFFEPGDARELATKILILLDDSVKLSNMGKRCRELALSKYSIDAMLDKYDKLYRKDMG